MATTNLVSPCDLDQLTLNWWKRVSLRRPFLILVAIAVFGSSARTDAAQQAYLRFSYQSWVGYGIERLEKINLCLPQTLQPFPLPDSCFPPGPYDYTSLSGVFHVIIHTPVPTPWNDAGREYTQSVYSISTGQLLSEGIGPAYTYTKTLVNDGCTASETYNFEIQQCGDPVADKNAGQPLSCPLGNPINQATGNKFQVERDIEKIGPFGIELKRVYNYTTTEQGFIQNKALGYGWTGAFLQSLHVFSTGSPPAENVLLKRPDGKQVIFTQQGSAWVSDTDIQSSLEEVVDAGGFRTGWRYSTEENTVETYDALGLLQSISDTRGIIHTLSYDLAGGSSTGHLNRIDSNTGEFLLFGYDALGRISTITDHSNRQWTYRYDNSSYSDSNLQYVDNPDGTTRQYHYEDPNFPHALTGITDERGIRYANYGYDAQGRAILSTHAGNAERVDIVYNADGTRTVTNSLGQPSTYTTTTQLGVALVTDVSGPGCSTCGSSNTSYTYDPANNNLLSRTENGVTTQFGNYDSTGQYGYRIEAAGTPKERRADYTYDSRFFNKITSITEPSVNPAGSKVPATATTRSATELARR